MLGDMVLEHIMQRAEFAEDGAKFCSLRANDVHTDAKETCYNWFCKVGTIRELLPRIYLELAIFPCWRFLIEQPAESLQRRVMMTRGFLLICWHDLFDAVVAGAGYLITCVNDIKLIFTRISSTKETAQGGFADSTRSLVSLMEPFVEFIMKSILNDASPEFFDNCIVAITWRQCSSSLSYCYSMIIFSLKYTELTMFPSSFEKRNLLLTLFAFMLWISFILLSAAMITHTIRLVGLRLSEQISQIATADTIVNEVIQTMDLAFLCQLHFLKKGSHTMQIIQRSLNLTSVQWFRNFMQLNEHVLPVCSKLLKTAKSCLNAKDKYLTSTIGFLHKNLHAATVPSSITI
ncbi:hypothetical protein V6N12_054425 [Hibiscus sabdariffa]|uniref:Uncharacterized protein n=1 Tax=Hibiscus sabdariffa TaxID=183260 RepID=A0ABR2D131_9ROSI